ncbi:retrovirus-related pol polyprotein from transposon TNT 1-94 [Tanacetum coccineum]
MFEKSKDPEVISKKISHKPIDYDKLNSLIDDFGKHFSPQQELLVEQAFWFHKLNPTIKPSYTPPVIMEVPSELPKKRTTPGALEEVDILEYFEINDLKAQLQDKDMTIFKLKDTIKSLRENSKEENVDHDKCEFETINRELENSVAKLLSKNERLCNEINPVKQVFKDQFDLIKQTCICAPNAITPNTRKVVVTPMNNVKKVRFVEPLTSSSNSKQVESSNTSDSNTHVLSSTGVKCSTSDYGSKPPGNKKNNRISQKPRKVNKLNCVIKPVCDVDVKHSLSKSNSKILCGSSNKSMFDGVHDKCLLDLVQNGNNCSKSAKKHKKQNIWKPTGHVCTEVGFKWKPTGRTFTIVGNSCPLTRFTSTNVVPPKQTTSHSDEIQKPEIKVYSRKPKNVKNICSSKIAKIVESKNANHSEPNQTWGSNAIDIPSSSSLFMTGYPDCTLVSGLRIFENDRIAKILGYGDYQLGNVVISRVYYVEGLGHNLFSVRQFCDADLEVLAKDGLARGIPRLKFQKDHLCSACALGKSKKSSHQPKAEETNQEKLHILHMDLCGPMRVASINEKRYILVIVDDYSRFTWVRFLKTKDEAPAAIIKCIKNIQVRLKATVLNVRTDNGTEFVNQTLREWYENVGLTHQNSVARTPHQKALSKGEIGLLDDWDHLFQPMFDEYFDPSLITESPVQEAPAPRAEVLVDSPVSTSIDQDATSSNIPLSQEQEHSPIIS